MDGLHAHERPADLVLARIHLRLGSLALARAELETLAGRDALDEDGLVDLAEARWRTGDVAGAGEAAVVALHDEEGPLLALIVASEAAAARGRPTEARRLAEKAMAVADGGIDAVFAGMPRGSAWPPDASAPPPAPTTMFDPPHGPAPSTPRPPHRPTTSAPASLAAPFAPVPPTETATIGLWEANDGDGSTTQASDHVAGHELSAEMAEAAEASAELDARLDAELPAGDEELERGRAALAAGDADDAAVRLGLVLRLAPALAPAVIELVEDRSERPLALVRGDAYRLVGRELEARRAFADAARPIAIPVTLEPSDDRPEGDPA